MVFGIQVLFYNCKSMERCLGGYGALVDSGQYGDGILNDIVASVLPKLLSCLFVSKVKHQIK